MRSAFGSFAVLKSAGDRQQMLAKAKGADAVRRVELLRLRFRDERPIREIAELWDVEANFLHREYRKGRQEFARALRDIVRGEDESATAAEMDQQCRGLLTMLH